MKTRVAPLPAALLALGALIAGCGGDAAEPAGTPDAGDTEQPDAQAPDSADDTVQDTAEDAPADVVPDASASDAGADAAPDTGPETDADVDTGPDATDDTGPDWEPYQPEAPPWDGFEPTEDLALPPELVPTDDEFLVVVLPDTQVYAARYAETFESQTRWVAEHAEEYNIVFVTHVGDIVGTAGNAAEWEVAKAAYEWLEDIDMPHGFSPAAHDTGWGITREYDNSCSPFPRTDCDAVDYRANFGPQFYEDDDWYRGHSESELSSYQVVNVGDWELLFLHLPQDVPRPELEWAIEVLDAHPGALVHLTTHRYLFDYRLTDVMPTPLDILPAGRFNSITYTVGGQDLIYNNGVEAELVWSTFIEDHPNIWAVHCGHVDAEYRQVSTNIAGLPVYEILVDYQSNPNGGGGWMRILRFRPSDNAVDVASFNTLTGELRDNGAGFDHSIDIIDDYAGQALSFLGAFGLTQEDIDAYLVQLRTPDDPLRLEYQSSLYTDGSRDSWFTLEVDFEAYMDASR